MAEADIPGVVMNQEYRVKLGKSFMFPKENAFHTIKYDFKPLSVDNNKPGKLRVGQGDEVNMALPVVQAESADDVAQFRGPKRPCTRECVLVINTETGEAILEKIGSSVNLKSLRDGRAKTTRDRSVSPAPFASKSQPTGKMPQPSKPPPSTPTTTPTHKRSKVSKPPAKSRTKKRSEPGVPGPSSSPGNPGSVKTMQPGSVHGAPKGEKSQKNHPKHHTNPVSVAQTDFQNSPYLALPKSSTVHSMPAGVPASEANPVNQGANQPTDRSTPGESSGSSSGSASSSSSDSSDSESESESPLLNAGASGGGVNVTTAGSMPMMQSSQPPTRVPGSMPVFGASGGGVSLSVPVQPSHGVETSSSSGSESDSSSDSSSGSSSDSSDDDGREKASAPVQHPQQLPRSFSTLEHELSCSSSDSD